MARTAPLLAPQAALVERHLTGLLGPGPLRLLLSELLTRAAEALDDETAEKVGRDPYADRTLRATFAACAREALRDLFGDALAPRIKRLDRDLRDAVVG